MIQRDPARKGFLGGSGRGGGGNDGSGRGREPADDCGRLLGGFARIRCPSCRGEHLLAFSCQTRNFCASCQAKRAALLAERLVEEVFAAVPHAMWTFTIPKALRGLFQRERKLLGILSRSAYDALLK
ncbi:MAG: transposase zinc-binding domain-containing protein, partial [Candidatus Binatia bacterium]